MRDRAPSLAARPALAGVRSAVVTYHARPEHPITTRLQVSAFRRSETGALHLGVLVLDDPTPKPALEIVVPVWSKIRIGTTPMALPGPPVGVDELGALLAEAADCLTLGHRHGPTIERLLKVAQDLGWRRQE